MIINYISITGTIKINDKITFILVYFSIFDISGYFLIGSGIYYWHIS
ncbi:hypothetical protein CLV81_1515 [Flagellimonas meridianipacifica]|uniref:Uncharacterized protein n=1 Tax=Flagellimonas meridianipacifica TaxID=1080225 RepID=A0A2T0MIU9_9FLAO|nr:hypothetical protein CLV81_1515 [Allomuricauda pacifica]